MPNFTPQQLKRALVEAGFTVFRTLPEEVVVAERVRENLIMDSGVRLRSAASATPPSPPSSSPPSSPPGAAGTGLEVRVVLRLQRSNFPGEDDAKLFERVRALAAPALAEGFREVAHQTSQVADPGDSTRTLDTFYEVVVARDADGLEAALEAVRFAFKLDRVGLTDG